MGQVKLTRCFWASASRIWLMVVTRPFGTRRINSSTSMGAGTTIVPVPHLAVILPVTLPILGRPLLSASFTCHVFLRFDFALIRTLHFFPNT